jgi:hypothetical protein
MGTYEKETDLTWGLGMLMSDMRSRFGSLFEGVPNKLKVRIC